MGMSGKFCIFCKDCLETKKAFFCGVTQQNVVKINVPKGDIMDQLLSTTMLDYSCPTTKIGAHENVMYFIQNLRTTFRGKYSFFYPSKEEKI